MKLSDIAQLAGVSVTTASYVINGKAEQQRISSTTVERVRAVVEEHGFTPNPQAAGLRSRHSRTLGFILPDLENPSYARIAKQLEQGARDRGYQLLIASSDDARSRNWAKCSGCWLPCPLKRMASRMGGLTIPQEKG